METGDFPTIRRQLQQFGHLENDEKVAGQQAMQERWQELVDMLNSEDDYTAMRESMYNVEWCLRTLVPWNLCLNPDNPRFGGKEPKPKPARPKGVYTNPRSKILSRGRRSGYARP